MRTRGGEAASNLALLLERVATKLPPGVLVLVLKDLPMPELARLSCVHKAFLVAWRCLQQQHPGPRLAPKHRNLKFCKGVSRLERAARYGDVTVMRPILAAGVDERGRPLQQSRTAYKERVLDSALWSAGSHGHVHAVELLLVNGADLHAANEAALRGACKEGQADVARLLLQHGANVRADNDGALRYASAEGEAAVVQLLIEHGANVYAASDEPLVKASEGGHADVVQLLVQHGASVRAADDGALRAAIENGHSAVVELLLQHGADVDAANRVSLSGVSRGGHVNMVRRYRPCGNEMWLPWFTRCCTIHSRVVPHTLARHVVH